MDIISIINNTYRSIVHASKEHRSGDYAWCIRYGANHHAKLETKHRLGFFTIPHPHYS